MGWGTGGFFRLCRNCSAEEILTAVTGSAIPLRPRSLMILLPARREARLRETYCGQLLWLIAAQLNALTGTESFTVPDYMTLFPPPADRRAPASAQSIRRAVLRRLRHSG